ncbi:MAG: hypothetical protein SGPRY_002698, partial [Prymnesium sp.]
NGTLERLYWGPALPLHTDLRYLNRSNIAQPFDPTVNPKEIPRAPEVKHERQITSDRLADPLAEALSGATTNPLAVWKAHRGAADGEQQMKSSHADFSEISKSTYERRIENISWRLLGMQRGSELARIANLVLGEHKSDPKPSASKSTEKEHGLRRTSTFNNFSSHAESTRQETGVSLEWSKDRLKFLDLPVSDTMIPSVLNRSRTLVPPKRSEEAGSFPKAFGSSYYASETALSELGESSMEAVSQPGMEVSQRVGKNMSLLEISDMGTGDYRQPSFVVEYSSDGSTISPLTYVSHKIITGKAPMEAPMPYIRPTPAPHSGNTADLDAPAATTLVVTMKDVHTGLTVDMHYTAMHHLEIIVRRMVVRNSTLQEIRLKRCMSSTVDFDMPVHNYWLTQLNGSWARERHVTCRKLVQGLTGFGSQRGTSSHQHCPFLTISEGFGPPEEEHGSVYGFSLVYSGSFLAEAEVVDVGRLRVNLGIQPQGFKWHLSPGEEFSTPECVCVYSARGLGRMSRQLHSLVREHLIPPQWRSVHCPVLVNTWEAEYFKVKHDSVVAMARSARALGIEMIVLDDGWFGQRDDITSSLGDWQPNLKKFPYGIRGVVQQVNDEGMQFGLWIEPEMVSTNSALYAAHPDWCLQVPGRPRSEGRNQLVLDLTRSEVREHIFESIATVLREANIIYVKWDMNRHLTEVFSISLPPERQGETLHRYMLGVYDLHEKFVTEFPHVRFEACSGGGGRFDLGMLFYCPQVWASDNTDALMRMKIQHGTSYIFPAMTVGSHFSVVPNHITQGYTRKRTRALVAMCGTFGFELDVRNCSDTADSMRAQIAAHKLVHPIVRDGHLYRLWDPFRVSYCAWQYALRKKLPTGEVVTVAAAVFAFNGSSTFWSNLVPPLQLKGLNPEALYDVHEPLPNNRMQKTGTLEVVRTPGHVYQLGAAYVRMNGATLMHAGIPVRFLTQDDSLLFLLKLVPSASSPKSTAGSSK